MLPLPKIALPASDYPRLERLARVAAQQGDMDAMFLMAEINRAEIVPDDAREIETIVTIGRWVTYRLAAAPEARALLEHVWGQIGGDAVVRQDERIVRKLRRVSRTDLCEAGLDIGRFGLGRAAS